MLSNEQVLKIASLARVKLSDEEGAQYARQLSSVLEYFEQMQEVPAEHSAYDYQVEGLANVTRLDQVSPIDEATRKKLVDAFPDREGDLLKVPGVFEKKDA